MPREADLKAMFHQMVKAPDCEGKQKAFRTKAFAFARDVNRLLGESPGKEIFYQKLVEVCAWGLWLIENGPHVYGAMQPHTTAMLTKADFEGVREQIRVLEAWQQEMNEQVAAAATPERPDPKTFEEEMYGQPSGLDEAPEDVKPPEPGSDEARGK